MVFRINAAWQRKIYPIKEDRDKEIIYDYLEPSIVILLNLL